MSAAKEGAKFLQMCFQAIAEGTPDFFKQCAATVELIKENMDAIPAEVRRRIVEECRSACIRQRDAMLKLINKKTEEIPAEERQHIEEKCESQRRDCLRAILWMEAMKPKHELGNNILLTLLALVRSRGRGGKVSRDDFVEALDKRCLLAEGRKHNKNSISETVRGMGLQKFPMPLVDFWDLEHARSFELRKTILAALSYLAKNRKRSVMIEKIDLMGALHECDPLESCYQDSEIEDVLDEMGIKYWPVRLAGFLTARRGKSGDKSTKRKTAGRSVKCIRRKQRLG